MKRIILTTLVLGTVLALAPAANAMHLSDGSGGGVGSSATIQPSNVTDGWMASVTLSPTPVVLHTDVLGGDGSSREVPTATGGDSFAWNAAGALAAATLAGVLLLVLASAAATRRRHRLSF